MRRNIVICPTSASWTETGWHLAGRDERDTTCVRNSRHPGGFLIGGHRIRSGESRPCSVDDASLLGKRLDAIEIKFAGRAPSADAAARDLGIEHRHRTGRWRNNRAENSHQQTRRREHKMQGFKNVGQPKDFSQSTPRSTTHSTSDDTSSQPKRTKPSGPRRCRHGTKSSQRREPDVPGDFIRALFGNVTEPKQVLPPLPATLGFSIVN